MQNSRDILLKRANSERVEFVERLYLKSPIRRGYQVLPVIKPSPPLASNTPRTQFYSLENLKERLEIQLRTAVELNEKALETLSTVLEPLVIEFELLRWQFHNLENHLAYHAQWQNAAVKQVDFYIERNLIAASIREMLELEDNGNSADLVDEIRESISESVSSFNPIAGLVVKVNDDGSYILPVTVYTDIDNEKFLTAFYEGVEEAFNNSAAAHIQRFAVSLDIHHISAAELYPKDPPVYGSEINLKQHISQFPKGVLILTTGGASTHAWG